MKHGRSTGARQNGDKVAKAELVQGGWWVRERQRTSQLTPGEGERSPAGRDRGGRRGTAPQPARRPPTSLPARPAASPVFTPSEGTIVPSPRAAAIEGHRTEFRGGKAAIPKQKICCCTSVRTAHRVAFSCYSSCRSFPIRGLARSTLSTPERHRVGQSIFPAQEEEHARSQTQAYFFRPHQGPLAEASSSSS